jgi:hypothetical protein
MITSLFKKLESLTFHEHSPLQEISLSIPRFSSLVHAFLFWGVAQLRLLDNRLCRITSLRGAKQRSNPEEKGFFDWIATSSLASSRPARRRAGKLQ